MGNLQWLDALRSNAKDAISVFGNARKQELERSTCAAFLRCLGLSFCPDQLKPSKQEPPDVVYDSARFEVTYIETPGRRRHGEWKARQRDLEAATSVGDLLVKSYDRNKTLQYETRQPLSDKELICLVAERMREKADTYEARILSGSLDLANLDLLIYINMNVSLAGALETPFLMPKNQNWRSISVLVPPHGYVLHAGPQAPQFLIDHAGQPKSEWQGRLGVGMFDV